MRLRHPPETAPAMPRSGPPGFTRQFDVELITPIYGGGVKAGKPDIEMPFRAAAIRGQLRFWWRLLNRNRFPVNRDLFREECKIFGGMANNNNVTASRVSIWLTNVPKKTLEDCAAYPRRDGELRGPDWGGLPGYALFPGQGQLNKQHTAFEEGKHPAKLIFPPATFHLHIAIRDGADISSEDMWETSIKPAMRWWASFGGIGARTRRGLGSIKIFGLAPVEREEAEQTSGCRLQPRMKKNDAVAAWAEAINKLQKFRQGANQGRDPHAPPIPAGRSRWPEADSIREITGCHSTGHAPVHVAKQSFPRAVFGLPIITHFKGGANSTTPPHSRPTMEPADTTLSPVVNGEVKDRLASPLILKAMWNGETYTPIALLLPRDHLSAMGLKLDNNANAGNSNLPLPLPAGSWWPAAKATAMTGSTSDYPLRGGTGNVLEDFLDFFGR